jgi:hypothetical protein
VSRHDGSDTAERMVDLVLDGLATYRLTRLATADVISEPYRRSLVGRLMGWGAEELAATTPTSLEAVEGAEDPPKLARLITCRWCAGMWIAGGVVAARALAPRAWDPVARGLALSTGAALISRLETD